VLQFYTIFVDFEITMNGTMLPLCQYILTCITKPGVFIYLNKYYIKKYTQLCTDSYLHVYFSVTYFNIWKLIRTQTN